MSEKAPTEEDLPEDYKEPKKAVEEKKEIAGVPRREFLKWVGTGALGVLFDGNAGKLAEYLNVSTSEGAEKKEKSKVKFDIYFNTHAGPKEARELMNRVKGANVFVPEMAGWGNKYLTDIQSVSNGILLPEKFLKKYPHESEEFQEYSAEIIKGLYGTKTRIVLADVTWNSPNFRHMMHLVEQLKNIDITDFKNGVSEFSRIAGEFGKLQIEREKIILENLERLKREMESQAEKDGKEKKVLVASGAGHTGIYHQMGKKDGGIKRYFSEKPYIFDGFTQLVRGSMFGKKQSEAFTERAYFEWVLGSLWVEEDLRRITNDYNKISRYMRYICDKFSQKNIQEMFEQAKTAKNWLKSFTEQFTKHAFEKKILMPHSEREMEVILKREQKY